MHLRFLILSAFSCFLLLAMAQEPEHIYGKNKRLMSVPYYKQQAGLWKAVVDKDPTHADAWRQPRPFSRLTRLSRGSPHTDNGARRP